MKPRRLGPTCLAALLALAASAASAVAAPKVTVSTQSARPGDPVLVTVTGTKTLPTGKAGGDALEFFAARAGYQAVFAVPIDAKDQPIEVTVEGAAKPATVKVRTVTFPEAKVVVEEELANPAKADRETIDADNTAIIDAMRKATGKPQFARAFRRPAGKITSGFGEWRTFNDGHRSQHFGLDVAAREGAKVVAINAGTVTLVRDCFLAGTVVVVAHGGGVASAYYHLSKPSVAEGDVVKAGVEVGHAGKTGRATGPHLHLSVRVPGGSIDPTAFFKLRISPAAVKKLAGTK
ncbi:MAG: M23 family metallopeptidase [Deltaproteobacteria bacterium]|nr:M23 family metallopeptidase [Deltaproteobacteria bacterium]